ncbi:DUF6095 family protein [uncultured Psychroserpens sp.]|uniref:DUF6095 family protein n=1 Tax=uncultured Psychroserpens sp. TaxID=255436 RepID=UPI00260B5B2E|nr:DUF6095 family protein [uncultured Psychroserpens sp.]
METKRTDKDLLVKGIKTMGLTLVLMFLGPTLFYIGLSNKDKPLFIPILIVASILCVLAIYFAFKGLKTIMDSMFKNS